MVGQFDGRSGVVLRGEVPDEGFIADGVVDGCGEMPGRARPAIAGKVGEFYGLLGGGYRFPQGVVEGCDVAACWEGGF